MKLSQLLTAPNQLTLLRMGFVPFIVINLVAGHYKWALILFVLAGMSDGLDGLLARTLKQQTVLGQYLDPIADKGLLLSGIITLSISNWSEADPDYGRFPAWFPVLVISRDAVILVGAIILYLLNGKVHVKPNWTGKVATDEWTRIAEAAEEPAVAVHRDRAARVVDVTPVPERDAVDDEHAGDRHQVDDDLANLQCVHAAAPVGALIR